MVGFRELSTVDVIRAAIARYIQSSYHSSSNLSRLDHFCGSSAVNISEEESKDVELVQLLILCAEKIGSQQFDCASMLLDHWEYFSSKIATQFKELFIISSKLFRRGLIGKLQRSHQREWKVKKLSCYNHKRQRWVCGLLSLLVTKNYPFIK